MPPGVPKSAGAPGSSSLWTRPYLTAGEAAILLRVSTVTIYRWHRAKFIQARRAPGRRSKLCFVRAEIDRVWREFHQDGKNRLG